MNAMIEFSAALLDVIAQFLSSEPIIYLFGLVLLCFLCRCVKILVSH